VASSHGSSTVASPVRALGIPHGLLAGDACWRILNANREMEVALHGYANACADYAAGLRAQAAGHGHGLLPVPPTPIAELLDVGVDPPAPGCGRPAGAGA
jgi:hypothetical protein